jgi:site-specific DNA recombinase
VQERLSERRTNYSPRNVSGFLLSGVLRCGHCGNRMIGVSRKQAWTRRRDGTQQSASYRYYQCESRTNQGICTYNTHRAEDVEEAVRERLAEVDPDELATAVDDRAVSAYWQSEVRRLQDRLQQIDRRFSKSIGEAASDKPSRERLRAEGLLVADERLKVEEELRDAEWRAEHYVSTAERRRTRSAALELVVSRWGELELAEKQQLLRELVDHVRVGNGATEVVLRP